LGAESLTNNTAELSGVIWAFLFITDQSNRCPRCTYEIAYDSKYGNRTVFENIYTSAHPMVANVGIGIWQMINFKSVVSSGHVLGHSSVPGMNSLIKSANMCWILDYMLKALSKLVTFISHLLISGLFWTIIDKRAGLFLLMPQRTSKHSIHSKTKAKTTVYVQSTAGHR